VGEENDVTINLYLMGSVLKLYCTVYENMNIICKEKDKIMK